ncbi:MAG: histidine--tRNA ligase [Bacteroidales bacterium]|nr:histidine--tRNA ligase [Bacteroidales bacterium]
MSQVGIPKGTRDFLPVEMQRRNYIFNTIREVFRQFGFVEIQTPSMENLSTLMGKYGEEGDRLLFKILNSGNFAEKVDWQEPNAGKLAAALCEKGLRYDLTVPFARFVVQHRQELPMPFKRFQIQPVWRADRPQKGRYREFYQCDADIIGSVSLLNEADLLQMADEIFHRLRIRVEIKINNRKLLAGIAEHIGQPERLTDITVAMDKLDKVGLEGVCAEWAERGLSQEEINLLVPIVQYTGNNEEKIAYLKRLLNSSETAAKGLEELETLLAYAGMQEFHHTISLDPALARGLNYYTGTIMEIKALDFSMGSISGGGRYDDLTGVFGLKNMSGVGISFGAERIYDILAEGGLFPEFSGQSTQVLLVNFGADGLDGLLGLLQRLRRQGVRAELYPEASKLGKQFAYADARQIPYVVIIGEEERQKQGMQVKDMRSGEQRFLKEAELLDLLADKTY